MTAAAAKPARVPVPEAGVLKACLDLLGYERIWHRRWNSGAIRDLSGRPVRMGKKGDADILASPRIKGTFLGDYAAAFLWIECKSDIGKQTAEQKEFQRDVEAQGHHYIMVRSSDDLLSWLRQHGACD